MWQWGWPLRGLQWNTPIMHSYQCCSGHASDYRYLLGWCRLLGWVLAGAIGDGVDICWDDWGWGQIVLVTVGDGNKFLFSLSLCLVWAVCWDSMVWLPSVAMETETFFEFSVIWPYSLNTCIDIGDVCRYLWWFSAWRSVCQWTCVLWLGNQLSGPTHRDHSQDGEKLRSLFCSIYLHLC